MAMPSTSRYLTVMTIVCLGPGTSARVYVELRGRAGKTSKIWLGPGATSPGQTAEHVISWGPLGDLQQLVVGHDGSSTSPSWHLDYIEVVQPPAGQVTQPLDPGMGGSSAHWLTLLLAHLLPCWEWIAHKATALGTAQCQVR